MLDRKKIVVNNTSSFYQNLPESAAIETSLKDFDPDTAARDLAKGLEKVAQNSDSLHEIYDARVNEPEVTFFQEIELISIDEHGTKVPWLEEVEEIPIQPAFTELTLEPNLRERLHIPTEVPVYYGCWGHQNNSAEIEEGRKLAFGSVMWEIAPPVEAEDGYVRFKEETRRAIKRPSGLLQLAS